MATTYDRLAALLPDAGITKFDRQSDQIVFAVTTEAYRSPEGRDALLIVARLDEDGEYFKLFSPKAFVARPAHQNAFLRACMIIQWRTKLIQFEFDQDDGEIRPIIEFPLEDATLTARQLARCVGGMVTIMERYYPVLHTANETGVIDSQAMAGDERAALQQMIAQLQARLDSTGGGPAAL